MSTDSDYDIEDEDDGVTDPDVKKEFFKDHFDFLNSLENVDKEEKNENKQKEMKEMKCSKTRNRRNRNRRKYIYLVTINEMSFYFHKKIEAMIYNQINSNYLYEKLFKKYKGIKTIFVSRDYNTNGDETTYIYSRHNNSLFSPDNLEHKLTFTRLIKG